MSEALRTAALEVDVAPEGSLPMPRVWQQFMEGRWRFVEGHEVHGRRLLVAEVMPESEADPLPMTMRRVAYLMARGASQKQVAYELGLHRSTVARNTRKLLDRLGLHSTMELSALFGSTLKRHPELAPTPSPHER